MHCVYLDALHRCLNALRFYLMELLSLIFK
jgi:hypothetical protein